MKQGDYTKLAKQYINRPAYCPLLLNTLLNIVGYNNKNTEFKIAEIGAGTGKLTKMLLEKGLTVTAVEPNDSMRAEGVAYTSGFDSVKWLNGRGEDTKLENESVDWVIMASSFHWTNHEKSLPEFARILKKDGFFTAVWNPRNIKISEFHTNIENRIKKIIPELNRVSSGSQSTKEWEYVLTSTGHFKDCLFIETDFTEKMSRDRYLGAWHSVNDIQVQAGADRWSNIINMIEQETLGMEIIEVPYKMRSWTVKKMTEKE